MKYIDYLIPFLLAIFFISQYFNKKQSEDRKMMFLILGILILIVNIVRYFV